jgi:hypothetical protein
MTDLGQLPSLGWFQSGRWLPTNIVEGLAAGTPSGLGIGWNKSGGNWVANRTAATGSRTKSEQKLRTLREDKDGDMIRVLNRQLAGEKDFPVVSKILGAAIGKLGIDFASLLYSTVSGQLNSKKSAHVFARDGDEIWRAEAVGRVQVGSSMKPVYVVTLLLVDPFRSTPTRAAWILHEQRFDLSA